MHILLLDQRVQPDPHAAEQPRSASAGLLAALRDAKVHVSLCFPALTAAADDPALRADCWPIRLDQLPTTSHVPDWQPWLAHLAGSGHSLSAAAAQLADIPLGLLRESIRRAVTKAVDETDVDVIFVCQAGLLVEFAIETGPPVAAHADGHDLASLETPGRLRDIVAASLSSCEVLAADSEASAATLRERWIDSDPERPIETWPLTNAAEPILTACRTALARRFTA